MKKNNYLEVKVGQALSFRICKVNIKFYCSDSPGSQIDENLKKKRNNFGIE